MIGKLDFFGMSMIIDPKGEVLAEAGEAECEIIAPLDMQADGRLAGADTLFQRPQTGMLYLTFFGLT